MTVSVIACEGRKLPALKKALLNFMWTLSKRLGKQLTFKRLFLFLTKISRVFHTVVLTPNQFLLSHKQVPWQAVII